MLARITIFCTTMCAASAAWPAQHGPAIVDTRPFAVLPADFRHPESLAVDPSTGQVYVGSFDAREPASERNNQILRLSPMGAVLAQVRLGPTPVTGLAFHAGHLYFLNFGASTLQRLPAGFGSGSAPEDVARFQALDPKAPPVREVPNPDGTTDQVHFAAAGFPAINGLAFDRAGNAYVSDSFQGAIYRVEDAAGCDDCRVAVLARDGLLATTGALPFGANGLAVDEAAGMLYVNNAGDGRVLRLPLEGGRLEVLADGLYGADGLLLHQDRLWVAANQIDAVVAIDLQGKVRVHAGSFKGIAADGTVDGLLFPAASAVQGSRMIVANLALPLTATVGDEWEEQVTRWSLVQFDIPRSSDP